MTLVAVNLLSYTGTKGGMETYARELYRQVGRMDTGLEFVALASREGAQLDMSWFPGDVVDTGISGDKRFEWAFGELFRVARIAKRRGADLIHSPATLGPARSAMPSIVTMHDMLYWSHPELMSTPFYTGPVKWMERRAAANASHVLTDSQSSADEIVKFLEFDRARLHVVPLAGTPPSGLSPKRDDAPRTMILATGNRRPHKNWDGLIRALPHIDERIRPRIVITGSRGDDPLLSVVEETGMESWVDLKGWLTEEELAALYSDAAAMAMPSFCDGFCLPALEAMSVGIPVMLSDIPVYREVAGDAAIYFDPHDHRSIAAAMEAIVTDPARAANLSKAGRRQAAAFTWQRVANETLTVFRIALADRG